MSNKDYIIIQEGKRIKGGVNPPGNPADRPSAPSGQNEEIDHLQNRISQLNNDLKIAINIACNNCKFPVMCQINSCPIISIKDSQL